mgnify:CR=1 FL=1
MLFLLTLSSSIFSFQAAFSGSQKRHVKDARMADGEVVVPGTGDGQLAAIFDKLDQSGYKSYLSLEPHLANFAGLGSLEKEAAVRAENDTEKAFCIAYRALEGLLGK